MDDLVYRMPWEAAQASNLANAFANQPQQVFDPITQQTKIVGPIPDNPAANADGLV